MKIQKLLGASVVFFATLGSGMLVPLSAGATEVLNFAGLNGNSDEGVANYYNGGTGSLGSGPGTNYGISFGVDAITCAGQPGGPCDTAEIPGGAGANLLFFISGPGDVMDVAAGFTTGFSFYYASPGSEGSVNVYSGLDGTGTLLDSISLPLTPDGQSVTGCLGTDYCPYEAAGASFAGTAESVIFSGSANGIGFADITLGSETAGGAVPEPGTFALFGIGLVGALMRKRKVG